MSQQAIRKEIFEKLTPEAQGFWYHLQNSWNEDIPRECPYPKGSIERHKWIRGQSLAIKEFEGSMEALG
jgi:hypothetical protein